MEKPLGAGTARFLVTAPWSCWRSSQRCSLHFPLHCPSLSTPVKNRELQSLPFLQVAERSTIITEHKRAVLPLCPSWIRLQLIPGATSDRDQICLHRDRLNQSQNSVTNFRHAVKKCEFITDRKSRNWTVKDAPTSPAAVVEKAVPVEAVFYTPLEAANLLAHTAHHASYHSFSNSTRS